MTRRLVAGLFYSIDGVAAEPHRFQYDAFDDDLGRLMTETIARIDDAVLGRVTYREWSQYWPDHDGSDNDYAAFINGVRKHVVSRTLTPEQVTWRNASLVQGDLLDHVRALKHASGGDVSVQGSLSVVRQLVAAGLLDELTLIVHPVVAGSGHRLFDGSPATRLRLLRADTTEKGNLVVTYGPR